MVLSDRMKMALAYIAPFVWFYLTLYFSFYHNIVIGAILLGYPIVLLYKFDRD